MGIKILSIESSCDETAIAVVEDGHRVLANVISSQIDIHRVYGGVVPEIASREHLANIVPVYRQALQESNLSMEEIDAIAVTNGPGLIGSLLTGLAFAKGLSLGYEKPLIAVNHMVSHLYAPFIDNPDISLPALALVVSGGHTMLVYMEDHLRGRIIGQTRDDAAGEAFDKIARRLGLSYPGGPAIEKAAAGAEATWAFPIAFANEDTLEFSFSGLKSAVINHIHNIEQKGEAVPIPGIAASLQEAIVESLVRNSLLALRHFPVDNFLLSGGVAANTLLRERLQASLTAQGVRLYCPKKVYCTDNGAMVGAAAYRYFLAGKFADLTVDAYARQSEEDLLSELQG